MNKYFNYKNLQVGGKEKEPKIVHMGHEMYYGLESEWKRKWSSRVGYLCSVLFVTGDYVYTINSGISIDANEARHPYVAYYRLALVSIIAFALIYLYGRVIHDLKRRATARKRLTAQLRRESQSMQRYKLHCVP